MKKKLALILSLMLALVALFSFTVVGVSAEESQDEGWKVTTSNSSISVVKGSIVSVGMGNNVSVAYTLTYNGEEAETVNKKTDDAMIEYGGKPYVALYIDGTRIDTVTAGIIDTKDMEYGEKTVTIKVFIDKSATTQLGEDATFVLNVTKKDNTMTIIMIVMIALIVVYFIWSSRSAKKKQQAAQTQSAQLKIGDRVITIGGICGFVSEINDSENTFTLDVGGNSTVKFDKGAIYKTGPAEGTAAAEEVKAEEGAKTEVKTEETKVEAKAEEVKTEEAKEENKEEK